MNSNVTDKTGRDWREALAVYSRPRVIAMCFLGFSAGLPFLLVFSTLSAWLRDVRSGPLHHRLFQLDWHYLFDQGVLGARG